MTRAAVAVATTFYRPVVGGAEAAAERLASFLHRRGHRVTVFTKRTNDSLPWKDTIDGKNTGDAMGYWLGLTWKF